MTGTFGDIVLALSASVELSIVVKATLTLAIGLLGIRVASRARASRRYLVLAATFGVLLLLPLAVLVAPPIGIAVRSAPVVPALASSSQDIEAPAPAAAPGASALATTMPVARETIPARTLPSMATLLRAAWAIGVVLCLLPVAITVWRLRALRRTARPWVEGEALARRLAADIDVRRQVAVLCHDRVATPMTAGLLAPAIILPGDAPAWSDEDLERALVHELEHVRRADWPAHLLARTACALYWFHPLVWRAWRLLHLEADRACDDAVVARGEGRAFAEQLVTLAQRVSLERTKPILAMAGRGDLSRRVMAVLDPRQARGRAGARWAALVMVLTLAGVTVVSPLTAVERARSIAAAADHRLDVEPPTLQEPAPVVTIRMRQRLSRGQGGAPALQGDRFETISIRQSTETAGSGGIPSPAGNSFIADNVSLGQLVAWAHGIGHGDPSTVSRVARPWATIEGVPSWNDRFDIRAKALQPVSEPPAGTLGPVHLMVQWLLADRFRLASHWQPSGRPIYVLTQAPGDSRPQLRAATGDCARRDGWMIWASPGSSRVLELFEQRTLEPPRCGVNQSVGTDGTQLLDGVRYIGIGAGPLQALTDVLEKDLGYPVVDRTGLAGNFDIELRYTRYPPGISRSNSSAPPVPLAEVPVSPEWPVLADALRDQLGIQLTVETVDGEALVIDRVERPTLD